MKESERHNKGSQEGDTIDKKEHIDGSQQTIFSILCGKGLAPIISVYSSNQRNIILIDIFEIAIINEKRKTQNFIEAILRAYTLVDFEGKRILALLTKKGLNKAEKESIRRATGREDFNSVSKWTLECVINALFTLQMLSKEEYECLHNFKKIRNDLFHKPLAIYCLNYQRVDKALIETIQVLYKLSELPVNLTTQITCWESQEFWRDLGYYLMEQEFPECIPPKKAPSIKALRIQMPDPSLQYTKNPAYILTNKNGSLQKCEFKVTDEQIGKWVDLINYVKDGFKYNTYEDFTATYEQLSGTKYRGLNSKEEVMRAIFALYSDSAIPVTGKEALDKFSKEVVYRGRLGIGCPNYCGRFWELKPTIRLDMFEPVDPFAKEYLHWKVKKSVATFTCDRCKSQIVLLPYQKEKSQNIG